MFLFNESIQHVKKKNVNTLSYTASVAQLDAHSTGDQEVLGSTPAMSATFFVKI